MADIERIIDIQLGLIRKRLQERKLSLELTEGAKHYIAQEGYSPVYGARPLKRTIQKRILDPLALQLLEGTFVEGDRIVIDQEDGRVVFRKRMNTCELISFRSINNSNRSRRKRMNTIKTGLLLGALTGLLMLIGGWFGGQNGVVIAFFFAIVMNFGSYWFSDKIVLRMYHAQAVSEGEAPELYAMVKNLALRASMPMPRVYIIPGDTPNAFATGRNEQHAVVAVTEGILRILGRDELEGVIAHELTHIRNRDILIGSIAATLAGAIVMLAHMAQWAAMFGGAGSDDDEEAEATSSA